MKTGKVLLVMCCCAVMAGSAVAVIKGDGEYEGTSPPAPDGMAFVKAGTTPGGYVTITNAFLIDAYEVTNQKMAYLLQWAYNQTPH